MVLIGMAFLLFFLGSEPVMAGDSVGRPVDSVFTPSDVSVLSYDALAPRSGIWRDLDGQTKVIRVDTHGVTFGAKFRVRNGQVQFYDSGSGEWRFKSANYRQTGFSSSRVRLFEGFCLNHRKWEPWVEITSKYLRVFPWFTFRVDVTALVNPVTEETYIVDGSGGVLKFNSHDLLK